MSRSLMPSFSRPSSSRRIQLRAGTHVARTATFGAPPLREQRFLNRHVFQGRARRGRGSSGKQPEENREDSNKEQPIEEETPSPEPPSFKPEPPSTPNKEPTAKSSEEKEDTTESAEEDAVSPWKEDRAGDIRTLKASLISSVAGYDRGFAAVAKDIGKIRNIVESLETLSGSLDLTGEGKADVNAQELFTGTWKLVFSSAFAAGVRRPRVRAFPFTVGPVYQVVDVQKRQLDNVLELLSPNVPRLPWAPSNAVPKIRLTLRHDMSFSMSIVSITFKETLVDILDAGFEVPKVTLPSAADLIRSVTGRKSDGEFSLVYLDEDLRITEGDRSELRIFVKVPDLE